MEPGATPQQAVYDVLESFVRRADEDRRVSFVLAISALSLMIDAGVASTEQAVARLDRVRESLPESMKSERIDQQVRLVQDWLRFRDEAVAAGPVGAEAPSAKTRWRPEVIAGGRQTEPEAT